MKAFTILISILCCSTILLAQDQAYYVKQTQVSADMETFDPLTENVIFTKIVIKRYGIEFSMLDGNYSFTENNKIDRVDLENNRYYYEISFSDEMKVFLFFKPYPHQTSETIMRMAIISWSGLIESDPDISTFFRLVFHDDLIIE